MLHADISILTVQQSFQQSGPILQDRKDEPIEPEWCPGRAGYRVVMMGNGRCEELGGEVHD